MPTPALVAIVPLCAAAAVDVRSRRLPDQLIVLSVVASMATALISKSLGEAAVGATVFCLPLLIGHLINPAGLGFGDVKLGAALGLILGQVDWRLVLPALGLGCVAALAWLVLRRVRSLAFGPALVGGTAAMAVIGGLA